MRRRPSDLKGSVLGHRLINAQPDACGGELDEGQEVGVVFLVAGGDGPEMLKFCEEPLDPVPLGDVPGTEVFYQQESEASKRFAGLLREEAVVSLGRFDIEWFNGPDAGATYRLNANTKVDFYGMVRRPEVPAVLAETQGPPLGPVFRGRSRPT